jgi:hypothetical protein
MGPDSMTFRCVEQPIALSLSVPAEQVAVLSITWNVKDLDRSMDFYTHVIEMLVVDGIEKKSEGRKPGDWTQLAFGASQVRLEIVHAGVPVDQGDRVGCITCAIECAADLYQRARDVGVNVARSRSRTAQPENLKALLLKDPDGYELCFMEVPEVGSYT